MAFSSSALAKKFDPTVDTLAVVVAKNDIAGSSSQKPNGKKCYMIYPFCSKKDSPLELVLKTTEVLHPGDWIRIQNRAVDDGEVDPNKWDFHPEWLLTFPYLNKIAIEADIIIPQNFKAKGNVPIRTKLYKPYLPNSNARIPFIQDIRDTHKLLGKKHAGLMVCATLEYCSGDDHWRIVHVWPRNHRQHY